MFKRKCKENTQTWKNDDILICYKTHKAKNELHQSIQCMVQENRISVQMH